MNPPGQEFANKFVSEYGQKNNVSIEIDYTDWVSSFQKIATGIAAGTAPDIFMAGGLWTPVIASKNGSLELDSYIKDYPDWNDWYESCRQDVTYQGKVHAIPYRTTHSGTIVYRKSLFEKAGLDPTKPPTNWDEAIAMAAQVTQKQGDKWEVAGWYFNMQHNDLTQRYEDYLFQAGGDVFSEDRIKTAFNSPEGEDALQYMVSFIEKGVLPKEGMDSGVPNLNAYTVGKVALFAAWSQDVLNAQLNAAEIWADSLAAPPLKRKEQRLRLNVDKYMIYGRTKVPDQAWELLKALVTPEVNEKLVIEGIWGMPVRKAAENAKLYEDPRLKVFVENGKYGKPRQIVVQHFDVQPAMGREIEAALRGAKSVKQALKDMDEEVTKIIRG